MVDYYEYQHIRQDNETQIIKVMENSIASEKRITSNENNYETILNIENKYGNVDFRQNTSGLSVEEGRNFFRYLKYFKLVKDPYILILPPNNHYYFDEKELRNVRTLINLKNLNLIRDLDSFLFSLTQLLPPGANFLGYFSYNKMSFTGDSIFNGLSTRLNNFLDFRTDHNMDGKELTERLYKFGFRLINMTEMNGLTYFYSKTFRNADRMSA